MHEHITHEKGRGILLIPYSKHCDKINLNMLCISFNTVLQSCPPRFNIFSRYAIGTTRAHAQRKVRQHQDDAAQSWTEPEICQAKPPPFYDRQECESAAWTAMQRHTPTRP